MDLDRLFAGYGRALAAGDVDGVVEYYGTPCLALTDDFVTALITPDDLRADLEQATQGYTQLGMADVRYDLLGVDQITEKIARVRVRWEVLDADGAPLLRIRYEYTVRDDADAPRIYVVLSVDETDRQAALTGPE